jgi:mRNA-degrading endonuclease toxin of MazEF toxin-antitoxin module
MSENCSTPQRLGEFAGRHSAAEMSDVEAALITVLGLDD